jgi:hypothetical protein
MHILCDFWSLLCCAGVFQRRLPKRCVNEILLFIIKDFLICFLHCRLVFLALICVVRLSILMDAGGFDH